MMEKRQHTAEFKREAVRLTFQPDKTVKEVADGLGVNANMLSNWRRTYTSEGTDAFRGQGNLRIEDEEIRRLKKENADLMQERDIFALRSLVVRLVARLSSVVRLLSSPTTKAKKALAIFSRTQR